MNWEASILSLTYEDMLSVKRSCLVEDKETGINSSKLEVILDNVKCSLSKKDESIIDGEVASSVNTHKIFTLPDVDIIAGDIIEVNRLGKTYYFVASEPFFYLSHTEIPVTERKRI